MSAVLGIVRGHKGALKVYSELGQGTTFRVLFPALSGVINVSVREEERLSAVTNAPAVLIVDDEPVIRDMAILMLNEIGVNQVFTAEDGEEGVRVYKREQEKIGLVLLDLTMPRMDGEETFSQLRRINPHVKVVLSSGYSESDIKDRFMGKGLYGFIQKPYLPGVLQGVVRDVFDEHD